jgi:hypothetical protein
VNETPTAAVEGSSETTRRVGKPDAVTAAQTLPGVLLMPAANRWFRYGD